MNALYRLQLGPHLDLDGARSLVPYLRDLGVSQLYLSPILQARRGSTHGYDVCDPTRVSEELGGERALRELAAQGLPLVLDLVPNHMAADEQNPSWRDPEKRARFFDIDPVTGRHRRFFDIDGLAGVRQEDPEVFEATHAKVLELVRDGVAWGLRIDHPDGLADPAGYLRRLAERGARRVWVEKILERGEGLRDWPVQGTVGYEFLNDAAGVFVDPAGEAELTALWSELCGDARPFGDWAHEAKLEQATTTFAGEVERLGRARPTDGLAEALATLPIYRTYVEPWSGRVEQADRAALTALPAELCRVLLLERAGEQEFVTRFQQTSPPIMAKGVEDTAFYRYLRLLALNDVGGDPGAFGIGVDGFHAACLARARRFPGGMLSLQTHDTKRSGDVRARLGALAGRAGEWAGLVREWRSACAPLRAPGAPDAPDAPGAHGAHGAPDAVEQYLVFQTLAGAWPIEAERIHEYLEKALREAKRHTTWAAPDAAWEEGVQRFARALRDHEPFRASFDPFIARLTEDGERAALGQLCLQLTTPGVPALYQGDEQWCNALVDPDNRRPVDWDGLRDALAAVRGGAAPEPATRKLHMLARLLALRARRADAFAGAYVPLRAGPDCVAFLRGAAEVLVIVLLRDGGERRLELPAVVAGRWRGALAAGEHELSGTVALDELVGGAWPVAVLERTG